MKLSVVIVNYNVKHYLEQCLRSVLSATSDIESEIYVVDNNSHDHSLEYLEPRFPQVKFVASSCNLGFARANNYAIRKSIGEYVLLLNPDTFVGEDVLKCCVAFMDAHADAGGVGVRMMHPDGSDAMESRRGIPSPMTAFYKMIGLCRRFPHSHRFAHYYMGNLSWEKPGRIEILSGAFCLLRRKALNEVGLLDEDFFMYGEDIDLSYRLIKGGWQNWYLPLRILHYKGESTEKSSFRYVHVFYGAMLIFFRKHYSGFSFLLSVPIKLAIYVKALIALCSMLFSMARRSLGFYSLDNIKNNEDARTAEYVFIGNETTAEQCRTIADANCLNATFISITDYLKDKKAYHKNACAGKTYIIYDMSLFTYREILIIFAELANDNVLIGTFHPSSGVVITDKNIYM
jgi:GT2 family glycosyltransferase